MFQPSADVVATRKKQLDAARKALQAKRGGSASSPSQPQASGRRRCSHGANSLHGLPQYVEHWLERRGWLGGAEACCMHDGCLPAGG